MPEDLLLGIYPYTVDNLQFANDLSKTQERIIHIWPYGRHSPKHITIRMTRVQPDEPFNAVVNWSGGTGYDADMAELFAIALLSAARIARLQNPVMAAFATRDSAIPPASDEDRNAPSAAPVVEEADDLPPPTSSDLPFAPPEDE